MTPGYNAYRTYLAFVLHFRKGSGYNAFDFNFRGNCKEETFKSKGQVVYTFAKIEREHPNLDDQIRFFYPAFARYAYVKASDVRLFYKESKEWESSKYDEKFLEELRVCATSMNSYKDLFVVDGVLPFVYELHQDKLLSFESAVILHFLIPALNSIDGDLFVWPNHLKQIQFHTPFVERMLTNKLVDLQTSAIEILKSIKSK